MKRAQSTFSLLAASLGLAACGGGGGGDSDRFVLSGQLTIPSFSSSMMAAAEVSGDDDRFHAVSLTSGRLAGSRPIGSLDVAGTVGLDVDDPIDVRSARLPAGDWLVRLDGGEADVTAELIHRGSGAIQHRMQSGEATVLRLDAEQDVDIVLGGAEQKSSWRVRIERVTTASTVVRWGQQDLPGSDLQARYLQADEAMRIGEVVVCFDEASPNELPPITLGGLERKEASASSPIAVYRLPTTLNPTRPAALTVADPLALATARAAVAIESIAGVRGASPNFERNAFGIEIAGSGALPPLTPNDEFWSSQWHFKNIRMEEAWEITTGSSDVVVGIVDSGIVSSHPDFTGRLTSGFDFISDPSIALDGDGRDADPEDPGDQSKPPNGSSWHGTHVAGTIGANGNDGVGVAGMDWQCQMVMARGLGRGGSGLLSDILEAVRYCAGLSNASGTTPQVPNGRVDVLNLSLGGGGFSQVESDLYAQIRNAGVLVIAAAGNDGTNEAQYPASYATVLSVGAVRFDDQRTGYSNFASTVAVYAPGGDLGVDQSGDGFPDGVLSPVGPAGATATWSFLQGTSMACPHVAGLASLMMAAAPSASPTQIETWILSSAAFIGTGFANGRIDGAAALSAASGGGGGATNPLLVANPTGVDFGTEATTATIELSNGGGGRAEIDSGNTGISFPSGSPAWLSGNLVAAGATANISASSVELVADRTGLAPGRYLAEVILALQVGNTVVVPVAMEVEDTGGGSGEEIFVILIEELSFETVAQAQTNEAQALVWSINLTPDNRPVAGNYWLVAGTDRDNDDFLGDEGELFGIWPLSDESTPIAIGDGSVNVAGLDFQLASTDVLASSVRAQRRFRLLR